jgi:cytochrome P450
MRQTKNIVGNDDPDTGNGDPMSWMRACRRLKNFSIELAKEKIKNPSDDITSILLNSNVENNSLTEQEFAQFFMLLVVAGMETTTHSLAHGMKLLTLNHEERSKLVNDFENNINSACEEILRLEPPVYHFRRTVKDDCLIGDFPVQKGDKIVMWYYTANRDPLKFNNPNQFIIDRDRAYSHTSFGAPGVHHCLGAQLARMEMRIFYEYLLKYMPKFKVDIRRTTYSKSRWGNGLKILPTTW